MSNTNTSTQYDFAASPVQVKPKLAVTGIVTGIGDCKTTGGGDGDYERLQIILKNTRGSKKVFPTIMFRKEMFSVGQFDPALYTNYKKFPQLATVKPGKKLTIGETFLSRYRQDVMPSISVNKKTGDRYPERVTGLMAICGGTLEGVQGLAQLLGTKVAEVTAAGREPGDFGIVELTVDEILDILRTYVQAAPQVEQLAVIKQAKDLTTGLPNDNYELDTWRGPLNDKSHEKIVEQAEKSQGESDISKRIQIRYDVSQ